MTTVRSPSGAPTAPAGGLLTDLYELTMAQSYLDEGIAELPATFSLFCRKLPPGWGYLVAAGLEDVLADLERLGFTDDELSYLRSLDMFRSNLLERLRRLRFTGAVRALPEGTIFFAQEPVLEVTAPMLEAQLVETLVLNRVHFQTLVASKAARSVDAAQGRTLVDFSLRRTPGPQAGLRVARGCWIAGFDATSNVLAGREYGIPIAGTMAHSYVQAFPDELAAFRAFVRAYPDGAILLVDTFDTIEGTRRAIEVARELARGGSRLRGVRLDSGDLAALSVRVRQLLDEAGCGDCTIFASGGLDEYEIARLLAAGAPIDGFGVGTRMAASADAPVLDMAYKLVAFAGEPTLKLSEGKATLPGAKQVWRAAGETGLERDLVELDGGEPPRPAEPLLNEVMVGGRHFRAEPLAAARERLRRGRALLPKRHRTLAAAPYPVEIGPVLAATRERLAREAGRVPVRRGRPLPSPTR